MDKKQVCLIYAPTEETKDRYVIRLDPKFNLPSINWEVYSSEKPVDGHWLVRLKDPDPSKSDVVAVTSHKGALSDRTYEFARKYALELAKKQDAEFIEETRIAKPSDLETSAQTKQPLLKQSHQGSPGDSDYK